MEQRSKEWFEARRGKFTASEVYKLMGIKGLGKTGESYIFEKAVEVVYGVDYDDNFTSFDMQRGIELEPVAFDQFAENHAYDFWDVQKSSVFTYEDYAGASPDGLVNEDAVLEIKCPKPAKLFGLIKDGIDGIDSQYFIQMQMQMLCSGRNKAYFFNFAYYNDQPIWHEIEVPICDKTIEKLKDRLKEAIDLREYYVKELLKKQQF